jgi:DNA-binding PadR family transcriptional regulator
MARGRRGSDGLGREVVLGLLVEQPSNRYQLDVQLEQRFRSASYGRGTARQAVKQLVTEGLVCARDPAGDATAAAGGSRSATVYEATPAGVAHFRAWIRASVSTPPVREELHAKIALCRPTDLPRMIDVVLEAESVCKGKLDGLNFRVRSRRRDVDLDDWWLKMDLVVSTGDQAWWESRINWLQRVRVHLEEEWRRYAQNVGPFGR